MMKGIFVVLDGLGDLPNKQLDNQTPLEAADMPNINFLAHRGEMGFLYSVKPGFTPESSDSILSMFGNNHMVASRGQLEARGEGIKLSRGDLAFRTNFATVDSKDSKVIYDRRAGRTLTTKEAEILAQELNKIEMPCKFIFKPTVQHRGVLVFKGGFSDNISGNDSSYQKNQDSGRIFPVKALDDDENSHHSANIVNEFIAKAHNVLSNHPLNEKRKKKGLMPANYLLVRGPGAETPKLKFYRKWAAVAYMPLEKGFSQVSGMNVLSFKYPKLKNHDVYENLHKGLKKACKFVVKAIKKTYKKYDYIYIHIKETDLPGHDNKPIEKKIMLEYIDKRLFSFLRKFAVKKKIKVLVTGDHSTPCKLKTHTSDPVPVLLYNDSIPKEKTFCEKEARRGSLGMILGKDLLNKAGFSR